MIKNGLYRLKPNSYGTIPNKVRLRCGDITMEDLELSELGKKLLEMASKDDQVKVAVDARKERARG
jgi:hypothetical protein